MTDIGVFHAALASDNIYTPNLTQNLSLFLEEFSENLRAVGVSAVSGAGMVEFFEAINTSANEYLKIYRYKLYH